MGQSGNDGFWRRKRQGRRPQGRLAPMGAPLRCSRPSNTWGEYYQRQRMTGGRWYETLRRRGWFGRKCQGYWAGRGRGCGYPDFSLNTSSSWCWSSGKRRGWLPPAWDESWGVSKTRWPGNWRGRCHSGGQAEGESTPWRRRWERRQGLSQWKPTFIKVRMRFRSILRREIFWTCAR